MAILCGVDIVEIDRVRKSLETSGDAFRNRVYTSGEIDYCEKRKAAKFESYAVRFCAKEAVAKAFGTGIGVWMGWKDIEVAMEASGRPYVVLKGNAKKRFEEIKGVGISLSLSHCQQYAVAYAVLEIQGEQEEQKAQEEQDQEKQNQEEQIEQIEQKEVNAQNTQNTKNTQNIQNEQNGQDAQEGC